MKLFLLAVVAFVVFGGGCRSRERARKVGESSAVLRAGFKNLEDLDKDKSLALIYEISCNSSEWVAGPLEDDDSEEAVFTIPKLKAGDNCKGRIRNPSPAINISFLSGDQVLYETDRTSTVDTKSDGSLVTTLLMRRSYKLILGETPPTLMVPVVFADTISFDPAGASAELKCVPEFETVSKTFRDWNAAKRSGIFVFEGGVKNNTVVKCRQIQVNASKELGLSFYGDMDETFTSLDGKEVRAKQVTLAKVEIIQQGGSLIVTTKGDACKENEVFDLEKRVCVSPK